MTKELRVLGPPGTGKTTRIKRDVEAAVSRYGRERVLVASYSRAAARELVGRDLGVPDEHVGTLHALCYRALDRPVIAETRLKDWNEQAGRYVIAGKEDDGALLVRPGEETGDTLLAAYNRLRAQLRPRDRWPTEVTAFARKWEGWKDNHGYLDFADLISHGLSDMPEPPGNYDAGFFDEAQDFSAAETALIRQWGQHMRSFVQVGDDDQAIYSFRGASPDGLLSPLPPENVRVLSQSYRVPRAVHGWATRWIRRVRRRNEKAYEPRDTDGQVQRIATSLRESEALLRHMRPSLEAGKTVMVLASCAYMVAPFMATCQDAGVPYHNPYKRGDEDGSRWNPLTPARGVGMAQRLLAYLRPDAGVWGDESREWTVQDLRQWTELLKAQGVFRRGGKAAMERLTGTGAVPLDELVQWFEDDALANAYLLDLEWLERHIASSKRGRALTFALTVARRQGAATLREEPRLIVGTGHSVKGGEADVVYMFPDVSRAAAVEEGITSDNLTRLFYVMATRARDTLVLGEPSGAFAVQW